MSQIMFQFGTLLVRWKMTPYEQMCSVHKLHLAHEICNGIAAVLDRPLSTITAFQSDLTASSDGTEACSLHVSDVTLHNGRVLKTRIKHPEPILILIGNKTFCALGGLNGCKIHR